MAGKNLASKADDGFKPQFTVFLCFEWRRKCLPVILGKAKNSDFACGVFSLLYYFFNCGNAVFSKTEKKH